MKIAHIGLASFYTEGMTYQDNLLSEQNAKDGHEVLYISNAAKYVDGVVAETGYEDKMDGGVRLVRLPYKRFFTRFATDKLRRVKGLYKLLEDFGPDVILSHGLQYWSVLDVIRYKKDHPAVKFYADTHADYYTTGTNWLSRKVLHGMFYRRLVQSALPFLEKYLFVSDECRRFSAELYGVPEDRMEFYPLGGTILPGADYQATRARRRAELGVGEDTPLLVHAGKLEPMKRTDALLRAFAAVPELDAKLAVIGSIPEENKAELTRLMKADSRVVYLGWRTGAELEEYLCACDLYCQPGKGSAIVENAVCRNCPVLLYPHPDYVKDYGGGNICWARTEEDMTLVFRALAERKLPLAEMTSNSARYAGEMLDYRVLAARLYR